MMPLHPGVGRSLYRALARGADAIERECTRIGCAKGREFEQLRRAAGAPLPRDLRGLLDLRSSGGGGGGLRGWVQEVVRRLTHAATAPKLEGLDAAAGFAALKHVQARAEALSRLVPDTESSATTHHVSVYAHSVYAGFERARFQFRYHVTIANHGVVPLKLLSRSWSVADLDGRVREVQGPGVVGAFPTIPPGDVFEYESSCPLQTPIGTQRGHFVVHLGAPATMDGRVLNIDVAPFSYRTPSLHLPASNHDETPAITLTANKSTRTRKNRRRSRRRNDENSNNTR